MSEPASELLARYAAEIAKPGDVSPRGERLGDDVVALGWNLVHGGRRDRDAIELMAAVLAALGGDLGGIRTDPDDLRYALIDAIIHGLLKNGPHAFLLQRPEA